MKRALFLADALRGAGLKVIEYPGWEARGRDFRDLRAVVWHHDASPVGDSAGVPRYMLGQWMKGRAAAQIWVDRYGVWHILGAGVAYHAGATQPGKPGNSYALGIETDHTTGETMTDAMRVSLRHGTAAILAEIGKSPATGLEFHKTICRPNGRKVDPYGLDLATERRAVAAVDLEAFDLGDRMLAIGMTGDDVEDLQRILKVTVDGDFGPETDKAVRWVQSQHGLGVDGIVGPNTLKALIGPSTDPKVPAVYTAPEGAPTVYVFTDPRQPTPQYVSGDLVTKRWVQSTAELRDIANALGKNLVRITLTPESIDRIVTVGRQVPVPQVVTPPTPEA